MEDVAIEVATEVAKNGEPNLVLVTIIIISIVVGIYILSKQSLKVRKLEAPLLQQILEKEEKIKLYGGIIDTLSNSVMETVNNTQIIKCELKETNIKLETVETKIEDHKTIMSGMLNVLGNLQDNMKGISELQKDNIEVSRELLIRNKIQHHE